MNSRWQRLARAAWEGVWAHPLRSGLAAAGLMVGVGAVAVVVAVALGSRDQVLSQVQALGSNLITVRASKLSPTGARASTVEELTSLTLADARALSRLERVGLVAPLVVKTWRASLGDTVADTTVVAAPAEVFPLESHHIRWGRFFSAQENRDRRRLAVVGPTLRRTLVGESDLVGQRIIVQKQSFLVVGELEPKGLDPNGQDLDDRLYVPLATALSRLLGGRMHVDQFTLQAPSLEETTPLSEEVARLLRQRHKLRPGQRDDFRISTQLETISAQKESSRLFLALTVGVASLSLVVAGIGIMAVMLISVRERTPEIGVRRAVGGRRSDLMIQFLLESLILGLAGTLAGALVGILVSVLLRALDLGPALDLPWLPTLGAVGVGLCFTLLFGLLPARRAAGLDPAQALRSA